MKIARNQILEENNKKPIIYDLFYPTTEGACPWIIFCHGYKGFKDWGAWDLVAQEFVEAGFGFLKFNFSHNGGTMEQPLDFPDLQAFAENNFSHELDDLERIILLLKNTENPPQSISLIGHSRGGGIVLIKAEEDERVDAVVTWAGVSDFKPRFFEGTPQFDSWKKTGITYVDNSRTKQMLPHNFQFYLDFKMNEERFTIERAVRDIKVPYLIVHGSADPTVSLGEAKALHSWNSNNELAVIPDADHVFGAKHPFEEGVLPSDLKSAVNKTIVFLKRVLD